MEISLLPKFLQVELTYACNSHCSFCYNPTRKGKVDKEHLLEILTSINSFEVRHVQLIGGEVTILKDLPDYLRALDKVRWRSIVTNGRMFREDIKGLINEIYISLHGDKETHEHLTSEPGSYTVIEENIRRYVDWGVIVHSDTVLTKYNFGEIFDIARKAKQLGMSSLFLNIFQPEGIGSLRPDFSPSLEQIRSAISQMIRARDELGFKMQFGTSTPFCLDERLITERLAFRCGAGEWFASINPAGEFRICNHSTKSYGNVTSTPMNKIWHAKVIDDEYRNAPLSEGFCDGCAFFKLCRGGCRINEGGKYRVDPIVSRDFDRLLSKEKLSELASIYEDEPFAISYS
jgi:radical SAM protein with 4Fe4S-binding SPASM domain